MAVTEELERQALGFGHQRMALERPAEDCRSAFSGDDDFRMTPCLGRVT